MDQKTIASYGIGVGAGVVEYYTLKRILEPTPLVNVGRTNVASAIIGAGMLVAGFTKLIPENAGKGMMKKAVVANGLSLIALSILQGRTENFIIQNVSTRSAKQRSQPRPMSGCSSCNQSAQASSSNAFKARSTCPKCWPPGGVYS